MRLALLAAAAAVLIAGCVAPPPADRLDRVEVVEKRSYAVRSIDPAAEPA